MNGLLRDARHWFCYVPALRPRIKSDALSAIIMVDALRLAEIIRGMIEASITRRFCSPWTRSWSSTTAQLLSAGPMRQGRPGTCPRREIGRRRRGSEQPPRQLHAGDNGAAVELLGQIIGLDDRRLERV